MNEPIAFLMPVGANTVLAAVNEHLSVAGLSISREDAHVLAQQRLASLAEVERVEFGTPAVVAIAEAIASSPCITQDNVVNVLAKLQDVFYEIRDELPVQASDAHIAQALRGCLDEWGDAADVASMLPEEVMAFCSEYVQELEQMGSAYTISDDEGRMYVFDPDDWEYDEQADGWDGERWADDWDD